MRIIDIQNHLRSTLPLFDTSFNSFKAINNAQVLSNKLIINSENHELQIGDTISISGIDYIHEVNLLGKITPVSSDFDSLLDIDFYNNREEPTMIELQSNEPFYNGSFELLKTEGRREFTIKSNVNSPSSTTETINVIEPNLTSLNKTFEVTNIIDSDNFEVDTCFIDTDSILLSGGRFYNIDKGIRIYSSIDSSRMTDTTSSKNTLSEIYIISGDSEISRDRNIQADWPQRFEDGSDYHPNEREQFSVYVKLRTNNSVDPVQAQDYCRNEIKIALLKSLVGYKAQKTFSCEYDLISYEGDSLFIYNTSFYIHRFDFATTVQLNVDDIYSEGTYPVNKIQTTYYSSSDGLDKAQDTVTFNNK